jgi:hypothetical protein
MVKRLSSLMLVLSAAALFGLTACGNTVNAAGAGSATPSQGGAAGQLIP